MKCEVEFIYVSGQPRPYQAIFRNCTFSIDDDYVLDSKFVMHMRLNGVYDVQIYGSDFKNLRNLSNQYAYFDYGYGIYAINSGFTVSAPDVTHTAISDQEITVHPNPSNGDGIFVHVPTIYEYPLSFVVNDMMGRRVYYSDLNNENSQINLRGKVYDGMYIYMIVHGDDKLNSGVLVIIESLSI